MRISTLLFLIINLYLFLCTENSYSKTIYLTDSIYTATVYSAIGENWTDIQFSNYQKTYLGWENTSGDGYLIRAYKNVGNIQKYSLCAFPEDSDPLSALVTEFRIKHPHTFSTHYGLDDNQIEGDANFIIQVESEGIFDTLLFDYVDDHASWRYFIKDLSEWQDKTITLRLIIEPVDNPIEDWARWGEPVIIAAGSDPAYLSASYTNIATTYSIPFEDPLLGGLNSIRGIDFHPNPCGNENPAILVTNYWGNGRVHLMVKSDIDDKFEIRWTSPYFPDYGGESTPRTVLFGDLDNDGLIEIIYPLFDLGVLIFEWDGVPGSYNFGTQASQIIQEPIFTSEGFGKVEYMNICDIDNDGANELLLPYNSTTNDLDCFYIISSEGNWTTDNPGASSFIKEFEMPRVQFSNYGLDGSPYAMIPADFDGNGKKEVLIHNWNYKNVTILQATEKDTYELADTTNGKQNIYLTYPDDNVALFGGFAADIDSDGRDEVFLPTTTYHSFEYRGHLHMISFDENQSLAEIDASNITDIDMSCVVDNKYLLGFGIGDIDNDGKPNLYFTSYFGIYLVSAEFQGGDKRNPANWSFERLDIGPKPANEWAFTLIEDKETNIDTISHVNRGSSSKIFAHFTDFDHDGFEDIIVPFQWIEDSIDYTDNLWQVPSQNFATSVYTKPNENALSLRVLESKTLYNRTITLISPNGSEHMEPDSTFGISWAAPFVDSLKIEYSDNNGGVWHKITDTYSARERHFLWIVPSSLSSEDCLIRITSIESPIISDHSDDVFSVFTNTPPIITLPATSDTTSPGEEYTYTPTIEDAEQDSVVLLLTEGPAWMSVADNEYLGGTPGNSNTGDFEIFIRADDLYGGVTDTSYMLSVLNDQPPIPVTDLQLKEEPAETSLWLKWTAPGAHWDEGTASAYDMRYSQSEITESSFSSAATVSSLPAPGPSGSKDSVQVNGLSNSTQYYFALKSSNGVGQTSSISNVVSIITAGTENAYEPDVTSHGSSEAIVDSAYQYNENNKALATGSASITWEKINGPDDFIIDTNGNVNWTPDSADAEYGSVLVVLRATNDYGSDDDSVTVTFPEASVSETVTADTQAQFLDFFDAGVTMPDFSNESDLSGSVTVNKVDTIPSDPGSGSAFSFAGQYWVVDATVTDGDFNTTMVFSYDEDNLNGIAEEELVVTYRETSEDEWTAYPDQELDIEDNKITLNNLDHFSMFAPANDLTTSTISVNDSRPVKCFQLYQNYPNPFNPITTIKFSIPFKTRINISIFNILGQKVFTLIDENKTAGTFQVRWDASAYSTGLYFYQIKATDFVQTKKLLLVK